MTLWNQARNQGGRMGGEGSYKIFRLHWKNVLDTV